MKIEFFYKATGDIIKDASSLSIDHNGEVFETTFEYNETYIMYHEIIGWRVIDS